MKITTVPSYILRQSCTPVTRADRRLRRLLTQLQATLTHSDIGVGLAAPQLATNVRLIAINLPKKSNPEIAEYRYFINPTITKYDQKQALTSRADGQADLEGCLSIPHVYAPVLRPVSIELDYDVLDEAGNLAHRHERFTDFAARVVQHETDHLDGRLFTDHALAQNQPLYLENDNGDLERISTHDLYELFGGEF